MANEFSAVLPCALKCTVLLLRAEIAVLWWFLSFCFAVFRWHMGHTWVSFLFVLALTGVTDACQKSISSIGSLPAKEVMFSGLSVCLSARLLKKVMNWFWWNFWGVGIAQGPSITFWLWSRSWSESELENVHWIRVPVQIGDPIRGATWRVVLKHYRPISPLLILWQRETFGRG